VARDYIQTPGERLSMTLIPNSSLIFSKNRNRANAPDFANINLLGACNAKCYFCLGKEIRNTETGKSYIDDRDDTSVMFSSWKNWDKFIQNCKDSGVKKIYVTGQNTDSLMYKHLDLLVDFLHQEGFTVGLRTNGLLAKQKIETINKCENSVGYSIHTLKQERLMPIMGWKKMLDYDDILSSTKTPRVQMVVNRYNHDEFFDIVSLCSKHSNIRYMQARRVSSDNRQDELVEDALLYEALHDKVSKEYPKLGEFHGAPIYNIMGLPVCFWRTVKTTINSINYYTDGVISNGYFVVEGYLENR